MDGYWLITRKNSHKLNVERTESLPLKIPKWLDEIAACF